MLKIISIILFILGTLSVKRSIYYWPKDNCEGKFFGFSFLGAILLLSGTFSFTFEDFYYGLGLGAAIGALIVAVIIVVGGMIAWDKA